MLIIHEGALLMKKVILYIVILSIMVMGFSGCASAYKWDVTKLEVSEYGKDIQKNMISLSIKETEISVSTKTITLLFENALGVDYGFGHEPHLEVLIDDVWYVIPVSSEAVWTEELRIVEARSTAEEGFSLELFYDDLKEGTYRIIKKLYSDVDSIEAAVEFEIKAD